MTKIMRKSIFRERRTSVAVAAQVPCPAPSPGQAWQGRLEGMRNICCLGKSISVKLCNLPVSKCHPWHPYGVRSTEYLT